MNSFGYVNCALRVANDSGGCGAEEEILYARAVAGNDDAILLMGLGIVENRPRGMPFGDDDLDILDTRDQRFELFRDGPACSFHVTLRQQFTGILRKVFEHVKYRDSTYAVAKRLRDLKCPSGVASGFEGHRHKKVSVHSLISSRGKGRQRSAQPPDAGGSRAKNPLILISQQVLLHLAHRIAW